MTRGDRFWRGAAGFLGRAFTQNLGLKIVAAVIAVALFLVVRLQEKEERWVDVEVNVRRPNPSLGVALTSDIPDTIRVLIRGRPSIVRSARKGERPQVTVDLSGHDKAEPFYYYFEEDELGFESGIEVLDVDPQSVLVRLERLATKRLPVHVRTTGRVRDGAELAGRPAVTPGELTISGPASRLRDLEEIETEEVDIEGLGAGEHAIDVPVRRLEGAEIRHAADTVEVVFQVRWKPGKRTLAGLPVRPPEGEEGIEFQPAEVAVSLVGPQVMLDKLDSQAVVPRAVIPGDAPRPGSAKVEVEIKGLDEQISIKSIVPAKVQARLPAAPRTPRKAGQEQGSP